MRHGADVCAVYIGDPTGSQDDSAGHGTIAATLADGMLELTEAGRIDSSELQPVLTCCLT